jgi:AcrR family transcriptional regulator
MNDTRDRVLQTALDLFIEQGYETTSLREIAERVGVTKAALYYHFASKEEIFRTLMHPLIEMQDRAMNAIREHPTLKEWSTGLSALVDWLLPQRRLFELFENNQNAVRTLAAQMLEETDYAEFHEALHERLNSVLADKAVPLADRVRMAGAIGLVMAVLGFVAGKAFLDVPTEELRPLLVGAINDVLRIS